MQIRKPNFLRVLSAAALQAKSSGKTGSKPGADLRDVGNRNCPDVGTLPKSGRVSCPELPAMFEGSNFGARFYNITAVRETFLTVRKSAGNMGLREAVFFDLKVFKCSFWGSPESQALTVFPVYTPL